MNQTLGNCYQGKPELLQACLDDMEKNYNEIVSERAVTQARLAELEANQEAIVKFLESQINAEEEIGRETRETENIQNQPCIVSTGHYQRAVAYRKVLSFLSQQTRAALENKP